MNVIETKLCGRCGTNLLNPDNPECLKTGLCDQCLDDPTNLIPTNPPQQ